LVTCILSRSIPEIDSLGSVMVFKLLVQSSNIPSIAIGADCARVVSVANRSRDVLIMLFIIKCSKVRRNELKYSGSKLLVLVLNEDNMRTGSWYT